MSAENHDILLFITAFIAMLGPDGRLSKEVPYRTKRKCFLFEAGDKERAIKGMDKILYSLDYFKSDDDASCAICILAQAEVRKETKTGGIHGHLVRRTKEEVFKFECCDLETGVQRIKRVFDGLFRLNVNDVD